MLQQPPIGGEHTHGYDLQLVADSSPLISAQHVWVSPTSWQSVEHLECITLQGTGSFNEMDVESIVAATVRHEENALHPYLTGEEENICDRHEGGDGSFISVFTGWKARTFHAHSRAEIAGRSSSMLAAGRIRGACWIDL